MEWWYWLVIGICSLLSAFFSSADLVYGLVDRTRLKKDIEKGHKRAKLALSLAE